MRQPRRNAFTIPEMLAVIALIVIIIALMLPALGRSRELTRRAICLSNQHQIAVGMRAYAVDNTRSYPLNESAACFAMTSRSGWVGWADSRPRFTPYVETPDVFYCPSGVETKTCPNRTNYDSFIVDNGGQGWHKLAGWNAIPFDVPANYYVHSDYSIFPGFVRKSNQRRMTYLFGPDESINERSSFGFSRPTIPGKTGVGIPGVAGPSAIPLSADVAYSLNPSVLANVTEGVFWYWDNPYASAGTSTIMKAHLDRGGSAFDGLGAAFMDGHAEWRIPGVAGPRTNLYTNGANYNYVTWY